MDQHINLSRGVSNHPAFSFLRKHAGSAVALLLMAAGTMALWRLLAPLNVADVMRQIHALGPVSLAVAVLATLIGYAALIGYDASALRYLGKTVPRLSVGLGGFLGYSIGNTIGLSVVSGGAVRGPDTSVGRVSKT